jgi:S-adenosylmethionine hydrolase
MTDFGNDDHFVASLKGVIIQVNPLARIVDITHDIHSFEVAIGAFVLFSCYKYFPEKTIFLTVIDPGVGTSRKILLVQIENYFFIAPDNGVLTQVLEDGRIRQIREVKNNKFFLHELSRTFEARDKMAPVAGWLSKGIPLDEFGPKVHSYKKLKIHKPEIQENEVRGRILYKDKFGNLITNISENMLILLQKNTGKKKLFLRIKNQVIDSFFLSYSFAKRGELFFLIGSLNLVEIAVREASAAEKLRAKVGDEVRIQAKINS